MSVYCQQGKYSSSHRHSGNRKQVGFTLLEMVVVLVLLGVISSLAFPGLQRMYESVGRSLFRSEIDSIFNSLALSVQSRGESVLFSNYPEQADVLPPDIASRLERVGVEVTAATPVYISASGLCPTGGQLQITRGLQDLTITLRSPDCKVQE